MERTESELTGESRDLGGSTGEHQAVLTVGEVNAKEEKRQQEGIEHMCRSCSVAVWTGSGRNEFAENFRGLCYSLV